MNGKEKITCESCKYIQYFYNDDTDYEICKISMEKTSYKDEACEDWEQDRTDEELEAQRVDAAERENHRIEVEGREIE